MTAPVAAPARRTCYGRGCNHPECRLEHTRYCKRWALAAARRPTGRAAFLRALGLIEHMASNGWSVSAIAATAGVHEQRVHELRRRATTQTRVSHALLDALERAASSEPTTGRVDAALTRQRIRSLAVLGYAVPDVLDLTGLNVGALRRLQTGGAAISVRTAAAVRDAYARVGDRPGPSRQAARMASAKGWEPPAAWDDPGTLAWPYTPLTAVEEPDEDAADLIDKSAVLRAVEGDRAVARALTTAERTEVVHRLNRQGLNDPEIGDRLGCSAALVLKVRHAAGIPAAVKAA